MLDEIADGAIMLANYRISRGANPETAGRYAADDLIAALELDKLFPQLAPDAVQLTAESQPEGISAKDGSPISDTDGRQPDGRMKPGLDAAANAAVEREDARDLRSGDEEDLFLEDGNARNALSNKEGGADAQSPPDMPARAIELAQALNLAPDPDLGEQGLTSRSFGRVADLIVASFESNRRAANSPEKDPPRNRKGTTFFGGAGLEGAYIKDMVKALENAGLKNVRAADAKKWSRGMALDAMGVLFERTRDDDRSDLSGFGATGEQFNLVGYSYGGLQAAQAAADVADNGGKIDHLVLVATPISAEFLKKLKQHPNIGKVIIVDLTNEGDDIRAGMSMGALLTSLPKLGLDFEESTKGTNRGHFYYSGANEAGKTRRRSLAKQLFGRGLR